MNFFQRIGNALSRFMYGRNGVDRLCLTMIWAALLLDIINIFLRDKQPAAYSIVGFVSTVIVFLALYRMFSRNLEKRRAENARFMAKVWYPIGRRIAAIAGKRRPKALYSCGLQYQFFLLLARLLPVRALNRLVGLLYAKP